MNRNLELRAITKLSNGDELVQTGIWVRTSMTLEGVKELFERGIQGRRVDKVEFDLVYDDDD